MQNRSVSLIKAGTICYQQGLALQHKLVQLSKTDKTNYIILCEHEPVYTFGKRQSKQDMSGEMERLSELGADCEVIDRGGLTTFHGPGQLVCYPILNLHNFKRSAKWYVNTLEDTVINTCNKFKVSAVRNEHIGIWVGDNKVAAIGVNISSGVTKHGLALNCSNDLAWFNHITPCGIQSEGYGVTSLKAELGRQLKISDHKLVGGLGREVSEVGKILIEEFERCFQCSVVPGEVPEEVPVMFEKVTREEGEEEKVDDEG